MVKVCRQLSLQKDQQFTEFAIQVVESEVPVGITCNFTAIGIRQDGSQAEIQRDQLLVNILTPETLRKSNHGVSGINEGDARFEVLWQDKRAECTLKILPPRIVKIKT